MAGRLHPDRLIDASAAERSLAERRMREINEAWRVLQDPARRRRYDDSRLQGRKGPAAERSETLVARDDDDEDLVDVLPEMGPVAAALFRHLPWVALLGVLVLIFVVTAYASKDDPVVVSKTAKPGACLDVSSGPTTTLVACSGPHELRIIRRVDAATDCPDRTERRRLGTDGLFDCVRPN